jgi:hypothetical protein
MTLTPAPTAWTVTLTMTSTMSSAMAPPMAPAILLSELKLDELRELELLELLRDEDLVEADSRSSKRPAWTFDIERLKINERIKAAAFIKFMIFHYFASL